MNSSPSPGAIGTKSEVGRPAAGHGEVASLRRGVLRIVLIYAAFASLWILFSDLAAGRLFSDPALLELASILKGWLFVAVTTLLLYGLLRRSGRQTAAMAAERMEALNLLAAVTDSSEDAIFAMDPAGRFILVNRAVERGSGKPAHEILGRDETALFPPEMVQRVMSGNRRVMASGKPESVEEVLSFQGRERVVLTSKSPLRDKSGRIIGLVGISRDITERKQAEEALRRQVELTRRYLDAAQTFMVALDAEGRITLLNRKGCELLGYAGEELLGRNWFASCLPQPEGMDTVYPVFRKLMAGDLQAVEYCENTVLCRDGRRRLIAWRNACLTDGSGRIVGTLSSGEDITERREAEETLRGQSGELAARNAELERFNRAMVGRELDMIELKKQVNELSLRLGRPEPYPLAFLDNSAAQAGKDGAQ